MRHHGSRILVLAGAILFAILSATAVRAQEQWTHVYYQVGKKAQPLYNSQMIKFSGGGYIGAGPVSGRDHPLRIWRADSHGNLLWAKQYCEKGHLKQLVDDGDGTFTVLAVNFDYEGTEPPWEWILRCNGNGNIILENKYYGGQDEIAWAVRGLNGEIYILADGTMTLKRLDGSTGTALWDKEYITNLPPPNFSSGEGTDIEATPDGGVILAGYSENPTEPHATLLIKADADGNLEWARSYETTSKTSVPSVSVTADGHLMLIEYNERSTALMKLTASGDIEWQERFVSPDYPTMTPALLRGITECADGTFLVWGGTGDTQDGGFPSEEPFLMGLDVNGQPLWCRMYGSRTIAPEEVIVNAAETDGGYVFSASGRNETPWPYEYGPSLASVNLTGDTAAGCRLYSITMAAEATHYTVIDSDLHVKDWPAMETIPVQAEPTVIEKMTDVLICGDAYPGVTDIKVKKGPYRLKLFGWNFEPGSRVFIDGVEVPKATFKGSQKKTGMTKLVIKKGKKLKALLPEGQAVSITVVNPDGRESDPFSFTR